MKKSFSIATVAVAFLISGCAGSPLMSATVNPSPEVSSPQPSPIVTANNNTANNDIKDKNTQTPAPKPKKVVPPPSPQKIVYLTFDDGPNSTWTPQILDILKKYKAKATFFVLGDLLYDKTNISLAQQEIREGHSVQNHSWDHASMLNLGYDGRKQEIVDTNVRIYEVTGVPPKCFRPPYGATSTSVAQIAKDNGLDIALWNVDTRDWSQPGAQNLVEHVSTHVANNSIILFHDGGGSRQDTVNALPSILDELSSRGYEFKKLC